jgi:hypothetical protein
MSSLFSCITKKTCKSSSSNKLSNDDIKYIIDNYDTLHGKFKDFPENVINSVYYFNILCVNILFENDKIESGYTQRELLKAQDNAHSVIIPSSSKIIKTYNKFIIAEKAEKDNYNLSNEQISNLYNKIGELDINNIYNEVYTNSDLINTVSDNNIKKLFKEYHKLKKVSDYLYKKRILAFSDLENIVFDLFYNKKYDELPIFSKISQQSGRKKQITKKKK